MPRGPTTPGGNPAHPQWSIMNHCLTFHAGASLVAVKGGLTGTISGAGLTLDNSTGLTNSNQARFITLSSAITLTGSYSAMWRSKTTTVDVFNSLILSRSGTSTYLQMRDGTTPDMIFFRDNSAFVQLDNTLPVASLVDHCLVVTPTTTMLYSKLATDTEWILTDTVARTGNDLTFDRILDGTFSQSNVGELHYLQTFTDALTATDLENFADPYLISTPDLAGPVVGTCTIPIAGNFIEIPFTDDSLPIQPSSITGAGGFTIAASGGAVTVTNVVRVTPGDKIRLMPSRLLLGGETVTCSYAGTTITDSASTPNALATFSNRAVTNGSTATSGGGSNTGYLETGRMSRPVNDTEDIVFPWSTAGATITGTRAFGIETPVPLVGLVNYLYTEDGQHVYRLVYNAADRPSTPKGVIYRLTDGAKIGYIILDVTAIGGGGGDATQSTSLAILAKIVQLFNTPLANQFKPSLNLVQLKIGEQVTKAFNSKDYRAQPIELVIETHDKVNVATIPDVDLVKTETSIAFDVPVAVYQDTGSFKFSIRDPTTKEWFEGGRITVSYEPLDT